MAKKRKEVQEVKPELKLRRYKVSLRFLPDMTFVAYSPEQAWLDYKAHFGIISTAWTPEIMEETEEAASV
jgi:hypothetical protein